MYGKQSFSNFISRNLNSLPQPPADDSPRSCFTVVVTYNDVERDKDNVQYYLRKRFPAIHTNISRYLIDRRARNTTIHVTVRGVAPSVQLLKALNKTDDCSAKCARIALTQDVRRVLEQRRKQVREALREHRQKVNVLERDLEKSRKELENMRNIPTNMKERFRESEQISLNKCRDLENQEKEFLKVRDQLVCQLEALRGGAEKSKLSQLDDRYTRELYNFESALPIYVRRSDIVSSVRSNQVSIVVADTGSGKSTQMVKYMLEEFPDGLIACTQPRKLAAQTLAERVSTEVGKQVGSLIGLKVGAKRKMNTETRVVFMTDFTLLSECIQDPLLKRYSVVVIDEAHERSIFTDLLLGMLKKCLPLREDLRVVVTSATIDPKVFVDYFSSVAPPAVLTIPGRTYPVEIKWSDEPLASESNFIEKAVATVLKINQKAESGDILVFLTSAADIETAIQLVENKRIFSLYSLPLHGRLQPEDQALAFEPAPQGKRKVVFSTNVAETSITIPGVKFVVDCGLAKEKEYSAERNMSRLVQKQIARSSADQRKGRAGRTAPGVCYRLYSEQQYADMRVSNPAEVFKVHLGQALLKLMALGVNDPLQFDFVESPGSEALDSAFQSLQTLGAVDAQTKTLTDLGREIVQLPLEPRLGKLCLLGYDRGIGFDAVALAAVMAIGRDVFVRFGSEGEKRQADECKIQLCHELGDVTTSYRAYRKWKEFAQRKHGGKWCKENWVNGKSMKGLEEIVREVVTTFNRNLRKSIEETFGDEVELFSACGELLASCCSENLAIFSDHEDIGYYVPRLDQYYQLHPGCALRQLAILPKWIVFDQILTTRSSFLITTTALSDEVAAQALGSKFDDCHSKVVGEQHLIGFGDRAIASMIGPKGANIRRMKSQILEKAECAPDVPIKIDVQRQFGKVVVHAPWHVQDSAIDVLRQFIQKHREKIMNQIEECSSAENVRVVMRDGGSIEDIINFGEYSSLRIVFDEDAEAATFQLLSQLDYVDMAHFPCTREGRQGSRAKVVLFFRTCQLASEAEKYLKQYSRRFHVAPEAVGKTVTGSFFDKRSYQVRFRSLRRACIGKAYVEVPATEDGRKLLLQESIAIDDKCYLLQPVQTNRDCSSDSEEDDTSKVIVLGLPRKIDKQKLLHALTTYGVTEEQIVVVRRKAFPTTHEEVAAKTENIQAQFVTFSDSGCEVYIRQPEPHNIFLSGNVRSKDLQGLLHIQRWLQSIDFEVDDITCTISIRKRVYSVIEKQCRQIEEQLHSSEFTLEKTKTKAGGITYKLCGADLEVIEEARELMENFVNGHPIHLEDLKEVVSFNSKLGRQRVHTIARECDTAVQIDPRSSTITVYGLQEKVVATTKRINDFLKSLPDLSYIDLKADLWPRGFMRHLMVTFKPDLSLLCERVKAHSLSLQLRTHTLLVQAGEEERAQLDDVLKAEAEDMTKQPLVASEESEDCPVCFTELGCENLRLELCGHAYHVECIQ